MKTERAIELLKRISDSQFDGIHGDERREALELAVMALEQNLVKESGGLVKDLVKDCISRQQAIDAVKDLPNCRNGFSDTYDKACIIGVLEDLPAAQTQWIPCSERLPDYGVSVLTWDGYCYCVEKRIPYIRDEDGEPISSDWWVSDEYNEYESDHYPNLRDGACIAWMPLPEPYGGESDED